MIWILINIIYHYYVQWYYDFVNYFQNMFKSNYNMVLR